MTDRRVTAVACLLLALSATIAASTNGIDWRDGPAATQGSTGRDSADGERPNDRDAPAATPDEPEGDRDQGALRLTLPRVLTGLLLLALVVVTVAVVARLRLVMHRRRRLEATGLRGPPGVPLTDEAASEEAVAEALDAGMAVLATGSPRNAVVAAWVALEEAAARAGVVGDPADTATDLVLRMLAAHPVDRETLERLAVLYREARFSGHDLTERHRAEARRCLERLQLQLGRVAR